MKNKRANNAHTLISGMVKLFHTPEKSTAVFVVLVPNLINTSLSLTLISPSVFPVTLRTFSSHQVELSIRIPQFFSSKDTSPWSLKFWHELAEDRYVGVSIKMLALQWDRESSSKHPTGTVTVKLIKSVSPSLTSYENDEGWKHNKACIWPTIKRMFYLLIIRLTIMLKIENSVCRKKPGPVSQSILRTVIS